MENSVYDMKTMKVLEKNSWLNGRWAKESLIVSIFISLFFLNYIFQSYKQENIFFHTLLDVTHMQVHTSGILCPLQG